MYTVVNVAPIPFRSGGGEWDRPSFRAGPPHVQVAGVVGGLALLSRTGTLPIVGGVA